MCFDVCINYMLNNEILSLKDISTNRTIFCAYISVAVWKIAYVLRVCCRIVVIVRFSFWTQKTHVCSFHVLAIQRCRTSNQKYLFRQCKHFYLRAIHLQHCADIKVRIFLHVEIFCVCVYMNSHFSFWAVSVKRLYAILGRIEN